MRKRNRLTVVVLLVGLVGATVMAGHAGAIAPTVVSCGSTITVPGSYVLGANCSGPGITITASNVQLSLGGHKMKGTGATDVNGIQATGVSNLQILGPGTITGYYAGLALGQVNTSDVENLTVTKSVWQGIALYQANDNLFEGVVSIGNFGHGFTQNDTSGNRYEHVSATSNVGNGIYVFDSTDTRVRNSTASFNQLDGISVDNGSTGNMVSGNTAKWNVLSGIHITTGSTANKATENNARKNGGFDLTDDNAACDANRWARNTFGTRSQGCVN